MIENASPMDKPLATTGRFSRPVVLLGAAGAAALLLLVLLFPAIRRWSRAERSVDATTVRLGTVTRGDLQRDVSVQGRVVAALHPTLFSPAQGIVSLKTRAGAAVRRGDVLATIESAELRSSLSQAQSVLIGLRTELERQRIVARQTESRARQQIQLLALRLDAARRGLDRSERTFREGVSNKADYETAQDNVRIAEMELEQATKELNLDLETLRFDTQNRAQQVARQQSVTDQLQRTVDELTIRSPFDGVVASLPVEDRDAIAPNKPVVTVVNLSSLELEIALPEEYASQTRIGAPALISFESRDYPGRVTAISPEVVNSQVNATVAFDGAAPPGLKQNQRLTTRLVFESRRNVLKVPRGAFVESGGGRSVYVVERNMATKRTAELGAASVSEVEVVSGLREGEQIVVSDTTPFEGAKSVLLR